MAPQRRGPVRGTAAPSVTTTVLRRGDRSRGGAAPRPHLREWHTMNAAERAAEWAGLCTWVAWLHDRYELSVDERLPWCWPQHPGLIEELWALKAWREEIYNASAPSAQAARYWHTEMRQTISAAITFYAGGCRAGHRGAPRKAVAPGTVIVREWAQADPACGIPPDMLPADNQHDGGTFLSAETMNGYAASRQAVPLSQTLAGYLRYDGSWWQQAAGGWLRVTDPGYIATLDRQAGKLAQADQQAAQASEPHPHQGGS